MVLKSTTIPFSGFYGSIHDSQLDNALEMMFSNGRGDAYKTLLEKAFDKVEWSYVHLEYAKEYAQAFAQEFNLKTLVFEELNSPKYYNYETDRIFCKIELSEIQDMFNKVDKVALNKRIKERFTSCDGFISHYDNKLADWPIDLAEWDHNQIGTLLDVYVNQESNREFDSYAEADLFNSSEVADHAISNNMKDCDRLFRIADYLRQREDRV